MSYLVIWSEKSIYDVQKMYDFLSTKDIEVAKNAANTIIKYAKLLELFPKVGRLIKKTQIEQRELIIKFGSYGYILFYIIENDTVNILAIKHQKESNY